MATYMHVYAHRKRISLHNYSSETVSNIRYREKCNSHFMSNKSSCVIPAVLEIIKHKLAVMNWRQQDSKSTRIVKLCMFLF
jgi:hypothetical protein